MSQQREGVPEHYPGRVVDFPADVSRLVFGIYGVQSHDLDVRDRFIAKFYEHCARDGGPGRVERCQFRDAAGFDCDMLLTYALDSDQHDLWWQDESVQKWWRSLIDPNDAETGYWREVMTTAKERFNYAAGTEDKVGSAGFFLLVGNGRSWPRAAVLGERSSERNSTTAYERIADVI